MEYTNVKDLQIDDEVLIANGSKFIHIKIIRTPRIKFRKDINGVKQMVTDYQTHTIPVYSQVKCAVKTVEKSRPNTWNGGVITWKEYDNSLVDYNDEKYFDLNFRDILLISRL